MRLDSSYKGTQVERPNPISAPGFPYLLTSRSLTLALAGDDRYYSFMSKKVADSILRGARQALVFAKGEADVSKYRVHIPHEIDVRRIRTKLGMTQEDFARQFGFSVNTLRHWEQGKRIPEGPTRAYLLVIDRAPKAVTKALRAA